MNKLLLTLSFNTIFVGGVFAGGTPTAALDFDGVDDQMTTTIPSSLTTWTYECWVKSSNAPTSDGTYDGPMYSESAAIIWNHGQGAFQGAASVRDANGDYHAASFGQLDGNLWYHLAATYDGTTLRAYRNGELMNEVVTGGGTYFGLTGTVIIGRHPTIGYYWQGTLDEARVWDHARTCQEINDNMNGILTGTESGLLYYYNFDHGVANQDNTGITSNFNIATGTSDGAYSGFTMTGNVSNFTLNAPFNITVASCSVGVEETENEKLSVFPNPTNGKLNFSFAVSGNYAILNSLGQTVRSGKLNNENSIDVSALQNGLYFIQLENKSTIRLVKN